LKSRILKHQATDVKSIYQKSYLWVLRHISKTFAETMPRDKKDNAVS